MIDDWAAFTRKLTADLGELRGGTPEVMQSFAAMARSATEQGALDPKTKELIAMAISVAIRCDDCIGFHAKAAARHGATRDEVMETMGMAIYMGAGPSVMYATHAVSAFDQFSQRAPKA